MCPTLSAHLLHHVLQHAQLLVLRLLQVLQRILQLLHLRLQLHHFFADRHVPEEPSREGRIAKRVESEATIFRIKTIPAVAQEALLSL